MEFRDLELIIKKRRTQINAKEAIARKERLPQLKEKIRPEIEAFLVNYEKLFCKNQKVNYHYTCTDIEPDKNDILSYR